jgi:TatD DNase family protein
MEFVDTHCHIHFENFPADSEAAYRDAVSAGVTRLICVGTTLADSYDATRFAAVHDGVWASAGAHPHEAEKFLNDPSHKTKFAKLLAEPKMVAAGELGLDYYKNYSTREAQQKAMRAQIEAALPAGLPFIFHVRDAWSNFWPIIDDYTDLKGVIHSFSSGMKQLDAALSRGLYIGLNGIMTFTKDQAQLEAARRVPLDRLVLETDAPFLAPAPLRGRTCEPKHVVTTAEFLAGLRSEPIEELSKATTGNAIKLFNLK